MGKDTNPTGTLAEVVDRCRTAAAQALRA